MGTDMKKHRWFCIPLLLTILSVVLLCGCAGMDGQQTETDTITIEKDITTQEIVEDRHRREEDYIAEFQTHMLSVAPFTLHMENRVYEETALREDAKKLLSLEELQVAFMDELTKNKQIAYDVNWIQNHSFLYCINTRIGVR